MQLFKEISRKKLIIYGLIVLIALVGAIFFYDKNYQLSKLTEISPTSEIILPENKVGVIGDETSIAVEKQEKSSITDIRDISINIDNNKTTLDLNLFNNPKFKALVDYLPKQTTSYRVGKRNIFEP